MDGNIPEQEEALLRREPVRARKVLGAILKGWTAQGGLSPDLNLSVSERSMFDTSGRPWTGRLAHTGRGRIMMGVVNGYGASSGKILACA